jgi:hypothetical protein
MEIKKQWFWATAGHVLEAIQEGFQHPDQLVEPSCLPIFCNNSWQPAQLTFSTGRV